MTPWSFKAFVAEDGRNLIKEWRDQQDEVVRAALDITLLELRAIDDWLDDDVEQFKLLDKEHSGLGEIRFYVPAINPKNRRPYRRRFRPAGIWRPHLRDFIILLGCEKPSRTTYVPHACFDVALRLKDELENGRGSICEYL